MPKLKLKSLNEFAKLEIVKSAKPDDAFILIPKSAIMGRNSEGNIILNKAADVSDDIRKEDMDASGYGQDGGDEMADSESSNWPSKDEAREHAMALEKCKGAIMKGAGLADLTDDDSDEMAQHPGESDDKFKSRKATTLSKRAAKSSELSDIRKSLADIPALIAASVAKAVEGLAPATQPRKGELVTKGAEGTSATGAKDERTLKSERLDTLKAERSALIAKMGARQELTSQEQVRKSQLVDEILHLETELRSR